MKPIAEIKRIDGKPAYRLEGAPDGTWIVHPSEIDAILHFIEEKLKVKRSMIFAAADMSDGSVSRCRHGGFPILERWILNLSDYSGFTVDELRRFACIEPKVKPHELAYLPNFARLRTRESDHRDAEAAQLVAGFERLDTHGRRCVMTMVASMVELKGNQ